MKRFYITLLLFVAALILLLPVMGTSCTNSNIPNTETADTSVSTSETNPTPNETEIGDTEQTTSEDEAVSEPDVDLSVDKAVVVLSRYAAEWEKTCANALAADLGLAVVDDNKAPSDKALLVIGYAKQNGALSSDIDTLGNLGYIVEANDGNVNVLANSEEGLTAAIEALYELLEVGRVIPASTSCIAQRESERESVAYNGAWAENIAHAGELANGVSTHFLDIRRSIWQLSNQNVVLTYEMKKENCFTSITNANGIPYAINTGDVYLQREDGSRVYSSDSRVQGRTNTYQLGYYYYNAHILDQGFGLRNEATGLHNISVDRTFHLYSDKLNLVQHLTTTGGTATGLAGYGQQYEIDSSRVKKLIAKDGNGVHESLDEVDWSTCEYVGFDVERAGIIGFILLPYDANEGKLSVSLQDGIYTVEQHIENNAETVYPIHTHIYFGLRMYTDDSHDFTEFLHVAQYERKPLSSLSITKQADGASYIGYDALRGAYRFDVNGGDFNNNYYNNPFQYFNVNAQIQSDDFSRDIYVYTHTYSGCLEGAVIMDENKTLIPIPLEVGKNFTGENEDSMYLPGDVSYGEVFFPLTIKANETKKFTVLNLYQNWGKCPLKQLSSIQFVAPYYHLSTGVTETNCIAPSFVYGKDNWLLPDFRAMSAPLWADQPQHTAIGQLFVVRYDTADRVTGNIENYQDKIQSYGPVYADVEMNYLSYDERIHISYRHVEMPQTDENRTYYSLRIDVREDVSFKDFKSDFSLFCFNGRHPRFNKLGYLDENNKHQVLDLQIASATKYDRFFKLGDEYPFFDYFEPIAADAVNFALIVKDSHIIIGGEEYTGGFLMRDRFDGSLNFGDLTLNLGEVTLKAGDCIYVDYILLPWGFVDSVNDQNVLDVREDSCFDPYRVNTEVGNVVQDVYVPKVRVNENQIAVFTVAGGDNNGVVRVYGLTSYERPVIEELINGEWIPYTDTTYKAFDGYSVYADDDGTYSVSFVVCMTDAPEEGRTFRVMGK